MCAQTALSLSLLACVGGQQLAVSDADTAPDELEYELVEAPIHGELIKTDGSAHTSMINGEVIRWASKIGFANLNITAGLLSPEKPHQRLRKECRVSGRSKVTEETSG